MVANFYFNDAKIYTHGAQLFRIILLNTRTVARNSAQRNSD